MDIKRLKNLIQYNPETGSMSWKPRPRNLFKSESSFKVWHKRYCGKEVGCEHALKSGYTMRVFSLQDSSGKNPRLSCHRVAWAIMTNSEPPKKIDHINQDATDNRWSNLRDGSRSVNERNMFMRKDNKSGFTGVSWSKNTKKWEAHVGLRGKKLNIGLFDSAEEADAAVTRKRKELGFSGNHGRKRP